MKSGSEKVEHWADLLEHISKTWERKKGRKYPFMGKDLKLIKRLCVWLSVQEILSLWDCYMQRSPYWGSKTGYSVDGFWAEWRVLLDDPNFKALVKKYEAELRLKSPEQVVLEFGL